MSLNTSLTGAGGSGWFPRRSFLKMTAGVVADGIFAGSLPAFAAKLIQMPFENGGRKLVRFPQKGEMILLRERPPLSSVGSSHESRDSRRAAQRGVSMSANASICGILAGATGSRLPV